MNSVVSFPTRVNRRSSFATWSQAVRVDSDFRTVLDFAERCLRTGSVPQCHSERCEGCIRCEVEDVLARRKPATGKRSRYNDLVRPQPKRCIMPKDPVDPNPPKPAPHADGKLTELEKYRAGEPFDSAGLYQDMDDDCMDHLIAGIREAGQKPPATGGEKPDTSPKDDAANEAAWNKLDAERGKP